MRVIVIIVIIMAMMRIAAVTIIMMKLFMLRRYKEEGKYINGRWHSSDDNYFDVHNGNDCC